MMRRKTLFDMPVEDMGRFECLTGNKVDKMDSSGKKARSAAYINGLPDFNFNKFV